MSFIKSSYRQLSQAFKETQSKCVWCLEEFDPESRLIDCFMETRILCISCLSRLKYKPQIIKVSGVKVYSLFEYDEEASRLLIQYKENLDIELAPVFLYGYESWLKKKYRFYQKVIMPSSLQKKTERGFNHLSEIYKPIFNDLSDPFIKLGTKKQAVLSKKERADIHFELVDQNLKKSLVLLDDVITTGSTFKEAIRLLPSHRLQCFSIFYTL